MKKVTKPISLILAIMMVVCAFSCLSFGASAAETNKITVSSNLTTPKTLEYNSNSKQLTVKYSLQSIYKIVDAEAYLNYDSSVLKLVTTDPEEAFPVFDAAGGLVSNMNNQNKISMNATSLRLYDFTTSNTFVTATFDIIGTGDTTVDLNVKVITGTTAKSYSEYLASSDDVTLVLHETVNKDYFTFKSAGTVTGEVVGSNASVIGDVEVPLTKGSDNVYTGTQTISKGTYKIKVKLDDKVYTANGTVNDDISNVRIKSTYTSPITFNATGGKYTFTFNADTERFSIVKEVTQNEISGDITVPLTKGTDGFYTGTQNIAKGSYKFVVCVEGKTYKANGTVYDRIGNARIKTTYTVPITLSATGGTYTFKFDPKTGKFAVEYGTADGILGDINVSFTKNANGIYTGTKTIAKGSYQFKVRADGKIYTASGKIADNVNNAQLKSVYTTPVTLNATGGTYTFTFDSNTGKLSVKKG